MNEIEAIAALTPLSTKEEAEARHDLDPADAYQYGGWAHLVGRIFATLDAERRALRAAEAREARLHRVGEHFADDLDTAGLLDWADRLRAEWRAAIASTEEPRDA